ncbi:MAG: circularly permuted type 2 ATP-grasp protein, partial [Nitrospirota bacterium]
MTRARTAGKHSAYRPPPGAYDEMCSAEGEIRGHWRYLIDSLEAMGPEVMAQRQRDTARMLRGDGATYNVYGTPDGLNRPWVLDPVPLLIGSREWAAIEAGLAQRAELLNLILGDLYGPRTLLSKGLVPPELVYGHQGFLRACAVRNGIPVPRLTLSAVDLARGPDGRVWVIGHRTQVPSGAGYAIENRTVMSRIMPSLFRDSHPHRLASFFRLMRESLLALAPDGREDPRVVILTPGPLNETYFEHQALANYLGYTLVEGADLMVMDGRVWLKSVNGREPVDVILRRVDGDFCDPLELRADSRLGVAGLLHAIRQGRVAVANPLGSGILENPGLMAFLPRLAKHFFGHDLRLPSVATWWCGQKTERDYVLANLDKLVLRPMNRVTGVLPVYGDQLSRAELDAWRDRIHAHPHLYVGQERVELSSVPTWRESGLEPRPAVTRTFLVARQDTYVVMPGGLTRVGAETGDRTVSNQTGAISKDTWVLASEPEKAEKLSPRTQAITHAAESKEGLPSRAAENLFWLARYAARAEATIRLIRNINARYNETLQVEDPVCQACLEQLLRGLTQLTCTYPGFVAEGDSKRLEHPIPEVLDVILNAQRAGTLAGNLTMFLKAASAVRNLVSADARRVLNDMGDELADLGMRTTPDLQSMQETLDRIMTALMAIAGATSESMCGELGWGYFRLGRRVERALLLATLVRSLLVIATDPNVESLLMESTLLAAESFTLYRRRYYARLEVETALDLLLLDETNPRSLIFQVKEMEQLVGDLPGQHERPLTTEMRRVIEAAGL